MDTLITDPYRPAHEAATGLSFPRFEELRPWGVYYDLERGAIDEDTYWRRLRECSIAIDPVLFHRTRRDGYRWLAGMRELVEECRGLIPTTLASNYPNWIADVVTIVPGLSGIPYFASYQCGHRKPSPRFFEALAADTDTAIEDMVLVDDKAANVAAFRRLGGQAVRFRGAADARRRLAELRIPVAADATGEHR